MMVQTAAGFVRPTVGASARIVDRAKDYNPFATNAASTARTCFVMVSRARRARSRQPTGVHFHRQSNSSKP